MPVKIHLLHKGNLDFLIKFIYSEKNRSRSISAGEEDAGC